MKRILVVDDEQHVVDHIVRIIERELAGEFVVAGTASSGRETLEKVPLLAPDIVVLDVRMPGLSGLETVRELQRRGADTAFVLSTAYERFDIAREALELGVTGYLLKPVSREALVQGLRNAADQFDRRAEAHRHDSDHRRQDEQVLASAAAAYLTGLMVGRNDPGMNELRSMLGLKKPWALVAAATFTHEADTGRAELDTIVQYKSQGLCGPLVSGRCLILLPLTSPEVAGEAVSALREALLPLTGTPHQPGDLRLGFADARPLETLAAAWPEAVARAARPPGADIVASEPLLPFDDDAWTNALAHGDADQARFTLETLLAPFEGATHVAVHDRYRVISLLGGALARLAESGGLDASAARQALDLDDLRLAADGADFCLMARARLPLITGALRQSQRWSAALVAAMDYVRQHYGRPLTLDLVAEQVGATPKRLSRHFIEELGQGFSDFLIDFRIEKAKVLLALPGSTIKQVSQECGYPDPNYFARLFKKVTGTTPSEFSSIS